MIMQQDKYCPMSLPSTQYKDMTVCQGSECAWYTDDGCAIAVLATRQYKMEVKYDLIESDDDAFNTPI